MQVSTLQNLRDDPVPFSKIVLGFNPFPYQEKLLRDPSKRICACMGRRSGKSSTIAAKAVHFAITRPKVRILIVSPTLRQSMEMFDTLANFVYTSPYLLSSIREKTRTRIIFTNGSKVEALPCGPSGHTLRGKEAHLLILDEAAFIPEEVLTNVTFPMVAATDGYIWLLSTPFDRDHVFYKAFTSKDWSIYHLPSSVNPLIKPEFLQEQKELIGEERFAMEYLAEFVDDAHAYYPMTLLRPCIQDYQLTPQPGFGGEDPGGKESYAAFAVVAREGQTLKVVHALQERGLTYTEFNLKVADYNKRHRLFSHIVDQTGLGGPIVEHLQQLGLRVQGLNLNDRNKEQILSNLKLLFEQKSIVFPHDLALINSLNAIEYERTRIGGYKFSHRRGTYDDLAMALALACWGVRGGEPTFTIKGVPKI